MDWRGRTLVDQCVRTGMCVASRCEYLHVYMYMYISTVITRFFDVALAQDFNINEETCGNNYM